MAAERDTTTPSEQVARLYEQAEAQAAKASENLVGSSGFASILGQLAENAAALAKLGNDAMDLVLRNLRVAGRRDVARLGRQLARTEDKLELVLQEVERLRGELGDQNSGSQPARRDGRANASSRKTNASSRKTKASSAEGPKGS